MIQTSMRTPYCGGEGHLYCSFLEHETKVDKNTGAKLGAEYRFCSVRCHLPSSPGEYYLLPPVQYPVVIEYHTHSRAA